MGEAQKTEIAMSATAAAPLNHRQGALAAKVTTLAMTIQDRARFDRQ